MPDVLPVSEAKKRFPSIVREASESLRLYRVANAQRHDAPRAVVIGEEALRVLIGEVRLTPEFEEDTEHGLWSAIIDDIDCIGQGPTREDAKAALMEAATDFAEAYLEDVALQFRGGRQDQFRYVLAIALAAGDESALAAVLGV